MQPSSLQPDALSPSIPEATAPSPSTPPSTSPISDVALRPGPGADAQASDGPVIDDAITAMGAAGVADLVLLARELAQGVDLRRASGSLAAAIDDVVIDGEVRTLPCELREPMGAALEQERDREWPSGRLRAVIAALGRGAVNAAHCGARNLAAVALPTMVRQAVGRALDVALAHGLSETARTVLSCGCLAVPAMAQVVLLVRDERRGEATGYSRVTRIALMALPAGAGVLGLATGTLLNAGARFAEVVLYPLLRDGVQARWPLRVDPDSAPTRRSLAFGALGYTINQLAVSRAFLAAPDLDPGTQALLPGGVVLRGLANWGGEAVDLWTLLMLHHASRHGGTTQPRMRIADGALIEALGTARHWDTMAARGSFVASFGQMDDSLREASTLARLWAPAVGEAGAATLGDWSTELIVGPQAGPTYVFWTDPTHARGVELQTLDEQRRGRSPRRQHAGNRMEPALPDLGPVALRAFDPRTASGPAGGGGIF